MSFFSHWYKQYLEFSKKDRNGIIVLSILIVLVIIINISSGFIKTTTNYDYSEFEKAINEWELSQATESIYSPASENSNDELQKTPNYKETNSTALIKIELNSADSVELTKLNGIGPVFASRIIRYRNLLGGFYKKEQLLEVYNFPEETFKSLENKIDADPNKIKKIPLNLATFADLLRHPYLNREQVQAIINYRNKNGAYQSINDLTQNNILDSLTFLKVEPYLEILN